MAITPDGKHAYVTHFADGTVSPITTATGAVSAPITVGKGPNQVAITPDGKHAYVTNSSDGTVSVITTATGAVSPPITVGKLPEGVAICPAQSAHQRRSMTVTAAVPTPTLAARQAQRPGSAECDPAYLRERRSASLCAGHHGDLETFGGTMAGETVFQRRGGLEERSPSA